MKTAKVREIDGVLVVKFIYPNSSEPLPEIRPHTLEAYVSVPDYVRLDMIWDEANEAWIMPEPPALPAMEYIVYLIPLQEPNTYFDRIANIKYALINGLEYN